MKIIQAFSIVTIFLILVIGTCSASDTGAAKNALGEFKSVLYEHTYTKVPSPGKLVSLKITDTGKIYYICKEDSGYVIYHTEIRPIARLKSKIEKEIKSWTEKWDDLNPDDLLLTRDRYKRELSDRIYRHSDVVWVRNKIIVAPPVARPSHAKARAK